MEYTNGSEVARRIIGMTPAQLREYDFGNPYREALLKEANKKRKQLRKRTPRCLKPGILESLSLTL